jgi:hypothetical protein
VDISPINRMAVKLAAHGYQQHCVCVDTVISKFDIVNQALWVNVCARMIAGDEIRVHTADASFMARMFVTFASGHDIRMELLEYHVFEEEDAQEDEEYTVALKGTHKWCIMKRGNPEPIIKNIAKKDEAEKQLQEYKSALAR